MNSVLLPFYVNLDLESYCRSDRREVIQVITEYLLGCRKFNVTKKMLSEYECHTTFQRTLKQLTPDYHKVYRRLLRKYARGMKVKIHTFDKHHLESVDLTGLKVRRNPYPSEGEVMKSMSFTINAKAYRLRTNRKLIRMTSYGVEDLKQSMYMRILAAYRVYLPSVGNCLPLQAFYSILHRSLASSIIDKMREFDSNKAQLTIPFALLGEDFESNVDASFFGSGKFYNSPEDILQAKETLYSEISHGERLELSSLFA